MNYEEQEVNVAEIVKKLVEDIQALDDTTSTSIRILLKDSNYDTKTMFKIYDGVIAELKKVGLYLDFGENENQRAGLPFIIPFKKGIKTNIKMNFRTHAEKRGNSSLFVDVADFTLSGGNAMLNSSISFNLDSRIKNKAKIELSIPVALNEEQKMKINNIIDSISGNDIYKNLMQEVNAPEYLDYTDVYINDIHYAIKSDESILTELKEIIDLPKAEEALSKAYVELIGKSISKNITKQQKDDILKKIDEKINSLENNEIQPSKLTEKISNLCNDDLNLKVKLTNYINKLPNQKNEEHLISILEKFSKNTDIFAEFAEYLISGKIVKNDKSVNEKGYTAYDILTKEPCLLPHIAFLWLISLRANEENIINTLANGIPATNITKLSYNVGRIRNYLKSKDLSDEVISNLSKPYYNHPDIANEFEYYIRTSNFVEENPITESGYTAKRLYEEHKDKLDISGVFAMLRTLRENPEKGLKTIADNFPQK